MGFIRIARFRQSSASAPLKWLWVAMLLLLVLFGHDALRIAEANTDHLAISGQVPDTTIDLADHEPREAGSTSTTAEQHPSRPDSDCGVNSPAATIQGSGSVTQIFPVPIANSEPPDSHGLGGNPVSEPIAPSHVRRALLQVYRI